MSSFLVTYKENKYEIQKFLKSHPAGEDILLPYKDKDITEAFDEIGHSKSALKILNKYLVEQPLLENPLLEKVEQKPLGKQLLEKVGQKVGEKEEDNIVIKKLFTNEDKYNIHKLFGAFALFSFAYRYFYLLPLYGDLGFSGTIFDNITLISHFILSSSSLLFHVLDKRIVERPLIIYEEYRLHAILFTTTAIVSTLFGLYADQFINYETQKFCLVALIFTIRGLVDLVTYKYGTVGVTAVRNNGENTFIFVRYFYSFYQICALGSMITVNQNLKNLGFNTLIAIQSSTFLMTLKRKSLIRYKTHIAGYSFALVLSYYVMFASKEKSFILQMMFVFFLRTRFNMNKYILWSLYATTYYIITSNNMQLFAEQCSNNFTTFRKS
jgi:hypothetical protein